MKNAQTLIQELQQLIENLRDPNEGDPWILAQDFQSLAALTVEEAYEFAESAAENDFKAMCDELGDLILHLFLYAQLAKELGQFELPDIIAGTLAKQKRRRLNFKVPSLMSAEEALKKWEENKQTEKNPTKGILGQIATNLPSMTRAVKLQSQAATVGFDWDTVEPIYAKIQEEINEFEEAVNHKDTNHMEEELGDLLFSIVNLARYYEINPDAALQRTNRKFIDRFQQMEIVLQQQGKQMTDCNLSELDEVWELIKQQKGVN